MDPIQPQVPRTARGVGARMDEPQRSEADTGDEADASRWVISPATGWRRKAARIGGPLFVFLYGPLAALVLIAAAGAVMVWFPAYAEELYSLQIGLLFVSAVVIGLLIYYVRRHLLEPLTLLRHWAIRMRAGYLDTRLPEPPRGEFMELAHDINGLSGKLEALSRDMASQVKRQTERLAQKTYSLEVLYDVAATINAARDLEDLLERFLYTLTDVVKARAGTVRLATEDGRMRLVASIGLDPVAAERDRLLPVNRCLCGISLAEGTLMWKEDVSDCCDVVGVPFFHDRKKVEMIAVPLPYRDQTLGVYNLFIDEPGLIHREDVKDLLVSIGRHLGIAIEKARLDSEAKRMEVMQERAAFAHELHDSLAQTLASLRFRAQMLEETLARSRNQRALAETVRIRNSVDEANTELRALLAHYRAPMDEGGLMPAIEKTVARFRQETGMLTFLQNEWKQPTLPVDVSMQVLRIIQEALCNVQKHSQAHAVRIMLRNDALGNYSVLVEDDGIGFREPAAAEQPGDHIGLSILQERARRIGGELRIESEPGEGTRVLLTFSCPAETPPPRLRQIGV